jgi:CRP-like cAMP-binding protein
MPESFEAFITAEANLTKDELSRVLSLSTFKKIRKRQLWLKQGEICKHKLFIVSGLLRTYRLSDNGEEYILRFSPENTWLVDLESFRNGTPSMYNIDALEDTEVMLWNEKSFNELFSTIPAFRKYAQMLMGKAFFADQERIMMNISYTSEEKYQDFITSFPDVFNRVPLHMVASYLGVSRETLSRIRHAMVKK